MCACHIKSSPGVTPQASPSNESRLDGYLSTLQSQTPVHLIASSYSFSPPADLSMFALAMESEDGQVSFHEDKFIL